MANLERDDSTTRMTAYKHPFPQDAAGEIFLPEIEPADPREWVPQAENVWFRPLCLGASQGYYVNLLRVRKSGVLSCHRHFGPVHAQVLRGRWYYLEHDWVAEPGAYIFEAPGETHTLIVPEDVEEMVTFFHVTGGYVYCDPDGRPTGTEDVFTKIEHCRRHYEEAGLGGDYVERYIR